MRTLFRSRLYATSLLATTLLLAACNDDSTAGATPPAQQTPGTLLSSKRLAQNPLVNADHTYQLTYLSTAANGKDIVPVNGQVAVPKGPAPTGGFPLISWGDGTTGSAPQCAPSVSPNADRDDYLNAWLDRGYAVLFTDYSGWGNQGPRADNHGRSNAAAMYDIVAAAQDLPESLRKDWLAVGHSQGGGASVWAAGTQAGKTYPLRGAIALAPTGPGVVKFMNGIVDGTPPEGAAPFISLSLLTAQALDPTLKLADVAQPQFLPQVEKAREVCLGMLFALPPLAAGQYLKAGPGYSRVSALLQGNDPSNLVMQVPVFIAQGELDATTVKPDTTRQMMDALCRQGAVLQYEEYPGVTHRGVMVSARSVAFKFADAQLANQGVSDNYCSK